MANVKSTSFVNNLFPQNQQDALSLQRQQALAESLMKQGNTAIDPMRSSGRYVVPISGLEGLSKIGQSLAGAMMQKNTDKKQADLSTKQQKQMMGMFGLNGGDSSSSGSSGAMQHDVNGTAYQVNGPSGYQQPMGSAPTSEGGGPLSLNGVSPKQAYLLSQLDPEKFAATFAKQLEPTEATKRERELGIDKNQALAFALAKGNKEGTLEFAPGTTYRMANGQTGIAADLKSGVGGGYGANGQPYAYPIQGAAGAAAQMAGATKAAEQGNTIFTGQAINGRNDVPVPGSVIQNAWAPQGGGMPQGQPPAPPTAQLPPNPGAMPPEEVNPANVMPKQLPPADNAMPAPQNMATPQQSLQFGMSPTEKSVIPATQEATNKDFIANAYRPVVQAADLAKQNLGTLNTIENITLTGKTGWGTEAKAYGANILAGLGIAPESAKKLASDSQVFNNALQQQVFNVLGQQKGPQTDQDAVRARDTFAQLGNTPQANKFIIDLAKATNNLQIKKASFYQNQLPSAQQQGDLTRVESEWSQKAPTLWDDPALQKWKKQGGGVASSAGGQQNNGAPAKITSDQDFNALPSGATFLGPDGKLRRKP